MGASFTDCMLYLLAALAVWILLRCARSLLGRRTVPEPLAALELSGKERRELLAQECLIGRSSSSDAVLDNPSVRRTHALLRRENGGTWVLRDLSGGETFVGNRKVEGEALLKNGDRIRFGSVSARLNTSVRSGKSGDKPRRTARGSATLLLLTLFEFCLLLQHIRAALPEHRPGILTAFAALAAAGWGLYFYARRNGAGSFEPETAALLLTAVGFSVAASSRPEAMLRHTALFLAGAAAYLLLGRWLREEERAMKLRAAAGGLALALLGITLLTGESVWGAKNWLSLAGNTLQPSEFAKIAYVCAGTVGLEGMLYTKQVLPFTVYSAAVVGTLALMGDFGTALVFFAAYLVIAAIRTGSAALISLSAASAGGAATLVLRLRPYVAARFLSLGRAWQDPLGAGYQQVRAMSALASGGLFGRGAGRGWLSGVVAADTDLVFGLVCEELGLITGVCCLMCLLLLAVYARSNIGTGRSGGYAVAAAGAVTMFMVQAGLNVFGSMDMIPFTGVTFPFVSRGGSSLIACWGLLAVVKAADVLRPENTGKPAAAANKAAKTSAPKKTAEKTPASAAGKTGPAKKGNFGSKTAEKTQEKKTPAAKTKTAAVKKPVQKPAGTKGAQR